MLTYQALTAAYKDMVIRLGFFEGLKTLLSSRDLFKLFDNDIVSRLFCAIGLGKNGIWSIFPRVYLDGEFCL